MTNGITLTVDGTSYHSLDDWGLAIGNNNCVGDPVANENYVTVPGLNKMIDLSAVFGSVSYSYRPITISFGALSSAWPTKLMNLRNLLNGKIVQIVFDDDPNYYWEGRCYISGFDRFKTLGTFTLSIPKADPYKYKNTWTTLSSTSTSSQTITNAGYKTVVPYIKNSAQITITFGGTSLTIPASSDYVQYPQFHLAPGNNTVTFSGACQLKWQEASL